MIKAILFDVGGTLIEVKPSVGGIYSNVAAKHKLKVDPQIINSRFRSAFEKEQKKSTNINKAWWHSIVSEAFQPFQSPLSETLFNDIYQEFASPLVWNIFPDALLALQQIKQKKIITAVASNWDERLPQLLQDLKLTAYFNHQFISYEVGHSKPSPDFFKHCLKTLNLDPSEVIHVGDDLENDFEAPQKLGIHSYLVRRKGENEKNEKILRSLEEILGRF